MQTIKFEEIESNLDSQSVDHKKVVSNNALVSAAVPILNKASQMKYFQSKVSTQEILTRLKADIKVFEESAEGQGVRYETVKAARYCLCTLLDEFAAKNGWADQAWNAHSLLVTFHSETWGGEQFFQLLDRVKQDPSKNVQLIELMYYCLVLGYMGKYQVLNNGKVSIENIKKELEKIINEFGGEKSPQLLLNNNQKEKLFAKKVKIIPLWILFAVSAAAILMLYTIFNWKLAQETNDINLRINKLNVAAPIIEKNESIQLLAPLLKNEIDNQLLDVTEVTGKSVITILGDELFNSGSDQIIDRYYPVMAAVGQALNEVQGRVVVSGFTDDQPIKSSTFPSNWHLSQGRADAVKKILSNYVYDSTRIRAEGKGSENPAFENNSADHRAKNRRVEITVYIEQNANQRSLGNASVIQN